MDIYPTHKLGIGHIPNNLPLALLPTCMDLDTIRSGVLIRLRLSQCLRQRIGEIIFCGYFLYDHFFPLNNSSVEMKSLEHMLGFLVGPWFI